MLAITTDKDDLRALTPAMASSLTYLINHGNANGASTKKEALNAVIANGNKAFLTDLAVHTGTGYKLFTIVDKCLIIKD